MPQLAVASPAASESPRPLMKDQAYAQLKELILNETYSPGTFLSERQLAVRMNMSKTPVKAALERLEAEGFISVAPQQGIVVRELSIEEIADHFELRLALETYIVRAIAGKLNAEQQQRLANNLEAQRASCRRESLHDNARLDTEFHLLLCDFLGNGEIRRVMLHQRDRMHRVINRVHSRNPERMHGSMEEHARIAEAILSGDGDAAAREMQMHLEVGRHYLLQRGLQPEGSQN